MPGGVELGVSETSTCKCKCLFYIVHRRKNASNALNVPSTDQKETS